MKKCRHREKFLITRPEEELTREELYELSFQEKNLSKTISIILNVKQFLPFPSVKNREIIVKIAPVSVLTFIPTNETFCLGKIYI